MPDIQLSSQGADERPTLILIGDDPRSLSGVANVVRQILDHTSDQYHWVVVAAGSPDHDKPPFTLTVAAEYTATIYPTQGFGSKDQALRLIKLHKAEGILLITDPHRYEWVVAAERAIRKQVPIMYLNIWDNLPYPTYNRPFYLACDGLFGISKQTVNINRVVLGKEEADKRIIRYIPHGLSEKNYYPITEKSSQKDQDMLMYMRKSIFGEGDPKFVLLYNARNIRRKAPGDMLTAYHEFYKRLSPDHQKEVALLIHTNPADPEGIDLFALHAHLFGSIRKGNIFYHNQHLPDNQMRYLYNMADATVLLSHQEGWGLSMTESMLCGKMIIGTVTGGIQDQMRFTDTDGEWINFNQEFGSNHQAKYIQHGRWAAPVFPQIQVMGGGSPTSPFIYEDRISTDHVAYIFKKVYEMSREERARCGLSGRDWALSDEAGFTATIMGDRLIDAIESTIEKWSPRKSLDIIKF